MSHQVGQMYILGRQNGTSFVSFVHTFLTGPTSSFTHSALSCAVARGNPTHNTQTTHQGKAHYLHLLEGKAGGEASTKAQLSYISMPRYFWVSLLCVLSLNREQYYNSSLAYGRWWNASCFSKQLWSCSDVIITCQMLPIYSCHWHRG